MEISLKFDGANFTIHVNGDIFLRAKKKGKFWKSDWTLADDFNKELFHYKMKGKFFSKDYEAVISSTQNKFLNSIHIHHKSKIRHIKFRYNNDDYLIIYHKGTNYSFLMNNVQYASMKKEKITLGRHDVYDIKSDNQINLDLLLSISCLISYMDYDYEDKEADFSIELGRIQKEIQPFDENWSPTP